MLDVYPLTVENADQFKPLYESFQKVAHLEYGWPQQAAGFETLRQLIAMKAIEGYFVREFSTEQNVGFLLFHLEPQGTLEIKVVYLEPDVPVKPALDALFNRFLEDMKQIDGWEVMSYPVLGTRQARFIDFLTWYGFKPVGQAVMKLNLMDQLTVEVFKKVLSTLPELPPGYQLKSWDPVYTDGVIDVLTEAFVDSVDALWDPRFRTRNGMAEALQFVQSGGYGVFWPSCVTILLNPEDKPVGVCLFNVVGDGEANIPLIGLLKSERQHKLGRSLLVNTLYTCIQEVLGEKLEVLKISATTATANFAAIKMYRYAGFQEDYWYPHVYQERAHVLSRRVGQWC